MFSSDDRELALLAVSEGWSFAAAARLVGASRTAVAGWARSPGVAGPRKEPVFLPYERKAELVARYEAGERAADLAAEAGVTAPAVANWARRVREEGELALMGADDVRARAPEPAGPPPDLEALRRRCEDLELENAILRGTVDILKKDPGADPSALTAAERAALAESLRAEFGLARVLRALSLPRSTFYHRLARSRRPDPLAWLRPLVREAFGEGRGAYGYRRVQARIRAGGARVSEKVVRRVMREEGLRAASPSSRAARYSSYRGEEGLRGAPNLLLVDARRDEHDFHAAAPGTVLVTDITEMRLPDDRRKVYVSPLVDLYDGRVVALSVGPSPGKALVREMLEAARGSIGRGAVIHSDRGWHYRTPEWAALCEGLGVARSLSRKGHSPDNAAAEGFFGRMKVEMFRDRDWSGATHEDLVAEVLSYASWYNSGRLKLFEDGYDTIDGRRARLGLAA